MKKYKAGMILRCRHPGRILYSHVPNGRLLSLGSAILRLPFVGCFFFVEREVGQTVFFTEPSTRVDHFAPAAAERHHHARLFGLK
jgi:hypothetical protein